MRLGTITIVGLLLLALVVMAIQFGVSSTIVRNGFVELEHEEIASDVRRAKNAVQGEVDSLDTTLWDWSSWDDTYAFALNGNQEYVDSNLPIATFLEQRLNAIIIKGADGEVVFGRAIGQDERDDPLMLESIEHVLETVALPSLGAGEDHGQGGVFLLDQGPAIIANRPISTTGGDAPAMGDMTMVRLLTPETIRQMGEELELELELFDSRDATVFEAVDGPPEGFPDSGEVHVAPVDKKTIQGFVMLRDVRGEPILVLRITESRHIFQHGAGVVRYNLSVLTLVVIAYSLLAYLMLNRRVLSRITRLSAQVEEVAREEHRLGRVDAAGSDEIAELGQSVNRMLQQIEDGKEALRRAHGDLEEKVAVRTLELNRANKELLALDKAKTIFLSSTSHELRTPLTAILGFLKLMERTFEKVFYPHLLQEGATRRKAGVFRDNLRILRLEAERLGRLVNDLLDLNKIEAGRMEWRDQDVDVGELVESSIGFMNGQLVDRDSVELQHEVADGLPLVHADRDRLRQVILNLLNNAVKFTDKGYVRLSAGPAPGGGIEIRVEDTGRGIAEEDLKFIFDIFYQSQIDNPPKDKPFGTGLGLAICKQIVEHYGGEIRVESEPGKGSVFRFSLPGAR